MIVHLVIRLGICALILCLAATRQAEWWLVPLAGAALYGGAKPHWFLGR
jgi:hypothetical protein